MRPTIGTALTAALLLAVAVGASTAGAVPGPGGNENSKISYDEAIDRATSNLTVTFTEGGQKKFAAVDYELTGRAVATQFSSEGQPIAAQQFFPGASLSQLVPDAGGRVAGAPTLVINAAPNTCVCGGSFRVDYSDLVLTNLSSGRVYRLADVSLATP
jgi:hypothetical protein